MVEVQVLREEFVLQGQHDLDQPGDTRGGLEVADIGFRRADQQRPARFPAYSVHSSRRLHLDRIPQRGTGAVCFQVVDIPAAQAGAGERRADESLLGAAIGHRQTTGGTVLIDRTAADNRADPVAIALRIAQALEHQHATALTAGVAVGCRVEGLAPSVR